MFAKYLRLAVRFNGDIGAAHTMLKQIGRPQGNLKMGRNNYKANVIYDSDPEINTKFDKQSLDKMYHKY